MWDALAPSPLTPSSKRQAYSAMAPSSSLEAEASNATVMGAGPPTGSAAILAVGGTLTSSSLLAEAVAPRLSVTVRLTVWAADWLKVCSTVRPAPAAAPPKSH